MRTPSLDRIVHMRLSEWPQRPPGITAPEGSVDGWLRGRPHVAGASDFNFPYLKLPGSDRMRTLPDGLWLNFGGTVAEPFVDIFAIEACGTLTNLLDKRSRFAPSTHSMLAVCPVPWLLGPMLDGDTRPRWSFIPVIKSTPLNSLVLPVRDIKVMYGLQTPHYRGFTQSQIPHAHEYFVPMDALTAENGHESPAIRALVARCAANANFLGAA